MKIIDIFIEFGLFIMVVILTGYRFEYAPIITRDKAHFDTKNSRETRKLLEHDYGI